MSESVTGYIDHVIFRNEENGYTVMILKGVEDEEELTCVGSFPVITMGASVELTGNYIQHPVYGKQFQAATLTEKMPEDAMAMERYLGSGAIKGIGAALAARGVRRFGSWRKSRNGWQRSRGSVKKRREKLQRRFLRRLTCEKQ